jgi:hypothetical protein
VGYCQVVRSGGLVALLFVDPPTPTSWTHAGVATKSRATISGLTSGTRYWFRVAAVNSNGQSGWSDPAAKMAP